MRIPKKKPFIGLICSIFIILVVSRSRKISQGGVREAKTEKVIFERDYEDESFPTDAKDFSFAKLGFLNMLNFKWWIIGYESLFLTHRSMKTRWSSNQIKKGFTKDQKMILKILNISQISPVKMDKAFLVVYTQR